MNIDTNSIWSYFISIHSLPLLHNSPGCIISFIESSKRTNQRVQEKHFQQAIHRKEQPLLFPGEERCLTYEILTQNATINYPMCTQFSTRARKIITKTARKADEVILLESTGILSAAIGSIQTLFETFETALSAHTTMDDEWPHDDSKIDINTMLVM